MHLESPQVSEGKQGTRRERSIEAAILGETQILEAAEVGDSLRQRARELVLGKIQVPQGSQSSVLSFEVNATVSAARDGTDERCEGSEPSRQNGSALCWCGHRGGKQRVQAARELVSLEL
eukprot:CAMPEP_0118971908 /NCGR_PEP_ID=MMETSP1173-20130426/8393_1 /TAXON_ID=1034831 /ORGANISM="Rhizochromulina marina cf, Strain CCMP1243" /LENGTH=119 /DNA_ID=CAMNT_0006921409 /DNA_START=311 /DNA_END=670 /DNA_ORIENTATION=+